MATALSDVRVFDGETFHEDMAVVLEGRHIAAVLPVDELPRHVTERRLGGGLLAPGYIDVQVNGGGGAFMNNAPAPETVRTIAAAHRRFGTTGLLPTVITDVPAITRDAIAAVRAARQQGCASVLGIHVEGPFLDPQRKGAHDPQFIRTVTEEDVSMLFTADCGALMLTLAPNRVAPAMIRKLADAGIRVSLGHSDAGYKDVRAALDAGASAFTHLFNAMSQLSGREPGMVGAALDDTSSFVGIIADGFHVHDVSLRLALCMAREGRFMLVTDAMPPAAGGPDSFQLQGRTVSRAGGRLQLADGTLAGSNLTMDEAVRYALKHLEVPLRTALQMASRNPARFLGREDLGLIAPGALASLVHLDGDLLVLETWVEGE